MPASGSAAPHRFRSMLVNGFQPGQTNRLQRINLPRRTGRGVSTASRPILQNDTAPIFSPA
jgi:hypothetical protein